MMNEKNQWKTTLHAEKVSSDSSNPTNLEAMLILKTTFCHSSQTQNLINDS